jgi:hypothetical protein
MQGKPQDPKNQLPLLVMAMSSPMGARNMAYRISATTGTGTVVSVIVETAEEALEKIAEFREDGFSHLKVSDMHGFGVDEDQLHPKA